MSDDLKSLAQALRSAPPTPDADAKARALTMAMDNFDRLHQETATVVRSKEARSKQAGFLNGVRSMLGHLTSRPALAASTSVAALVIGIAVIFPLGQNRLPPIAPKTEAPEAPEATSSVATAADAPAQGEAVADARPAPGMPLEPVSEPPPVDKAMVSEPPMADAEAAAAGSLASSEEARARLEAPADGTLSYLPETPPMAAPVAAPDPRPNLATNGEDYASAPSNPVKITAEEPVSTFSIDVDTASYALLRSSLNMGLLPAADQVRIEEMINYFPYSYPVPEPGQAFRTTVSVMPTPWNPGTRLVTICLQGELPASDQRPPLNLVFLIDTSGSMDDPRKLGLLKQSLALMLPELRPEDQIAIVAYAGSAGTVLAPTPADDREKILSALDRLAAGGSTAGAEGLDLAYQVARDMQSDGEVSRILLATDGDFNVGVSDPDGLAAYVARKREQDGTYLSVLGFGRGNLDDATMQALAQNGNGQAAYIDTLSEARKVLVDQLTGALFAIAQDVKIQVEWNPATIAEYRLIGYETRALAREDFNNDKVDAGEIGAGLQVTAIYEVTAPGSEALLNDPLRYGMATASDATASELGFLRLRWKTPGSETSRLAETPIIGSEPASDETRFAAAVAGFGQLLQDSVHLGDWSWDEAIELAISSKGDDPFGYRSEAITLMRLAQSLDH